jgi:hypothetical protein
MHNPAHKAMRPLLVACLTALAASTSRSDPQPCYIGPCGAQDFTHHGAIQDGKDKYVYEGVKAKLDYYDPTLCGDSWALAGSFWWVMLSKSNTHWVQAGWFKGFLEEHPDGSLAWYREEYDPSKDPHRRRDFWTAGAGAENFECIKSGTGGNTYVIRAGTNQHTSRDFGNVCFNQARFFGETWHPNNQMPGDKADVQNHVHFKECQTKKSTEGYKMALMYKVDAGTDYGITGKDENSDNTLEGEFEIWDERCPPSP